MVQEPVSVLWFTGIPVHWHMYIEEIIIFDKKFFFDTLEAL